MKGFYWVVDDSTSAAGLWDADRLDASTNAEAIREASLAWERLTTREQEHRDAFYVILAPELEEGIPDLDQGDMVHEFK